LFLSNSISADLTFSPQAQRDTDLPDLGFHFDPLDIVVSGVTINSNVTVTATGGVAIGIDYLHSSWGFILDSGRFISQGSQMQPNHIVRAHLVQEAATGNPPTRAVFYDNTDIYGGAPPRLSEARFRFTDFSQLDNDGYLIYSGRGFSNLEWTHCRVYNPSLVIDTAGSGTMVCGLTNSLWERDGVLIGLGSSGPDVTVHLRNNLVRNMDSLGFIAGTTNWTVRDNLFDTVLIVTNHGSVVENSYNASYQTAYGLTAGANNLALTNLTYEAGPLGNFYQPVGSLLLDAGSRNADAASLYHFTSTTNQVKETNAVVDIAFHTVALNASHQVLDFDGDGIPDYLEDTNQNGSYDAATGETDWQTYDSQFGIGSGPGLVVFTPLK
jgi:hypothetical protein